MARGRTVAALVAAMLLSVWSITAIGAEPLTDDPRQAAEYGAGWLAGLLDGDGSVGDAGANLSTALALASSRTEGDAFDAVMGWLRANAESVISDGSADMPGRLGRLILVAVAAGDDPRAFGSGSLDLVGRLQATLGSHSGGLFGAQDPTYDGAFRQGLALLGLRAAGVTPSDWPPMQDAIDWLIAQQCGAESPPEFRGAWMGYRSDTGAPCLSDPVTFAAPDTNQTALAVQGLEANGVSSGTDSALDYFELVQEDDGGFPFQQGYGSDPNSTALVIQALVSAGQDPRSSRWSVAGPSPYESLLSWQLGCDSPVGERGAFSSPFSDSSPDAFATVDAVPGAAGVAYPLPPVDLEPNGSTPDCGDGDDPGDRTPAGDDPPKVATSTEDRAPAASGPAVAVTGDPQFTG